MVLGSNRPKALLITVTYQIAIPMVRRTFPESQSPEGSSCRSNPTPLGSKCYGLPPVPQTVTISPVTGER